MRFLKVLYYLFLFSFFAINWWDLAPRGTELWFFLSAIAAIIALQIVSYKTFGEVIRLNTRRDSIVLILGMLLLIIVEYTMIK